MGPQLGPSKRSTRRWKPRRRRFRPLPRRPGLGGCSRRGRLEAHGGSRQCRWSSGPCWRSTPHSPLTPRESRWLPLQPHGREPKPAWQRQARKPRFLPRRSPPSRRRSARTHLRSHSQGMSRRMQKAVALDDSRRPSTEPAGWRCPRRMPRPARRTAWSSFFKGRCYAPVMGSRRKPPPTSAPPDYR